MAKNISLLGADYPDVPAVVLPKTGGGSATFVDADDIGNVEEALAIVVNGDTAPKAITAGQYLFIKNHSTLATGGYHATANITSGGAVSGSNVAADTDGIANALSSKTSDNLTPGTNVKFASAFNNKVTKCGNVVTLEFALTADANISAVTSVASIPSGYRPESEFRNVCYYTDGYMKFGVNADGNIIAYNSFTSGKSMMGCFSYIV